LNAHHPFRRPAALDAADPAVAAMMTSLQARIDLLQARLAGIEQRLDAPREALPFEMVAYGWVRRIAEVVAEEWGVAAAELVSARRTGSLIRPRFVLIWLIKEVSTMSLPQIGRVVGDRDHTTVMHALRRVEGWRAGDEVLRHVSDQMRVIAVRIHGEWRAARAAVAAAPAAPEGGAE
jgi:hypothetical protein